MSRDPNYDCMAHAVSLGIEPDSIEMFFIKLNIADFENGIQDMPIELVGYYFRILLKMYSSKGGKLVYDLQLLAKKTGTTARVMRRVLDELIGQGKFYVADGFLRNKRCDEERKNLITAYINRHVAAVKRHQSEKVSAKFDESFSEVSAKLQPNFSETIPNSPIDSKKAGVIQAPRTKNLELTNLESKKEYTPPTPSRGGVHVLPEIPHLNGSTHARVEELASAKGITLEEAHAELSRPRGKRKVREETPLSQDWSLPDEWRQWAFDNLVISPDQVAKEAEAFKDNALAKGKRWKDWFAAWRNWLRMDFKNYKSRTAPSTTFAKTEKERQMQRHLEHIEANRRALLATPKKEPVDESDFDLF